MTDSTTSRDVLSLEATAEYLGVSISHLRRMARKGTLPGVRRLGRRVLISRAALDEWLAAGQERS